MSVEILSLRRLHLQRIFFKHHISRMGVRRLVCFVGFFVTVIICISCQVLEVDDSFSEKRLDRAFLLEFYAPWCGHCRKLEPVYHQVYLELKNSPITVAKVDATKYARLASEYEVRGYPSIKFIQGDRAFTHNGERSKDSIVEFAKRAYGPQVRPLASSGKLNDALKEHSNSVFFMYVGPTGDANKLYTAFSQLAEKFAVLSYFYSGESKILPQGMELGFQPTVLVFKDGDHFEFDGSAEDENVEALLEKWVNVERFRSFPKIGGVGLNDMSGLGKMIVIFVADEKDDSSANQKRFKEIGMTLSSKYREQFHSRFQFVWMPDPETAGNIIMGSRDLPYVFILDPQLHVYYLSNATENMTLEEVISFIEATLNGQLEAHGGTGLGQRFKRLFYDIWTSVYEIYRESPWLFLMVFGIPTFVLSILCYTLCCLEPAEENEAFEGSDDDDDDVREHPENLEMAPQQTDSDETHVKKD